MKEILSSPESSIAPSRALSESHSPTSNSVEKPSEGNTSVLQRAEVTVGHFASDKDFTGDLEANLIWSGNRLVNRRR